MRHLTVAPLVWVAPFYDITAGVSEGSLLPSSALHPLVLLVVFTSSCRARAKSEKDISGGLEQVVVSRNSVPSLRNKTCPCNYKYTHPLYRTPALPDTRSPSHPLYWAFAFTAPHTNTHKRRKKSNHTPRVSEPVVLLKLASQDPKSRMPPRG